MSIHIEGYLVQEKLEAAIKAITGSNWLGREYKLPGTRYRFDIAVTVNDQIVAIEFDGHQHYQDSLLIKRDKEKDMLANQQNTKVVRIPYWVQLTDETLKYYLGLEADITQNFPHGFIITKHFPATFCELGVARFQKELEGLPGTVKKDVINSLKDRATEHGIEYVVPTTLACLLSESEVIETQPLSIAERISRIDYITDQINQFAYDDESPTHMVLSEIVWNILIDDMMETMAEVHESDPGALEPCAGCAVELIMDTNRLNGFIEDVKWGLKDVQRIVHGEEETQLPVPDIVVSDTIH